MILSPEYDKNETAHAVSFLLSVISYNRVHSINRSVNCIKITIKKATIKNSTKDDQRYNSSQNSNTAYNNANNGKRSSIFVILLTVLKADYRYDHPRKANKAIAVKNQQRSARQCHANNTQHIILCFPYRPSACTSTATTVIGSRLSLRRTAVRAKSRILFYFTSTSAAKHDCVSFP